MSANRIHLFLIGWFVFNALTLFSQQQDTSARTLTDTMTIQSPSLKGIRYGLGFHESKLKHPVDTGLSRIHYFDPADRAGFRFRNIGALGSAHNPLVVDRPPQTGFRFGYEAFDLYRFTKDNVPFYRNRKPFSRLNFLIGQNKEQTVEVTHSQNIGKQFNFGFHYQRYATEGDYLNQRTRHNGFALTSDFDARKGYGLKTMLLFNNVRTEENGGVKETNIFRDTSFITKELVKVELERAENKRRDISFHVHQYWTPGKRIENFSGAENDTTFVADSLKTQPPAKGYKPRKNSGWKIYHEADVGRYKFDFLDDAPDSLYYGLFFPGSASLRDTMVSYLLFFGNRAGVQKIFSKHLTAALSFAHQYHIIRQHGFNETDVQYADTRLTIYSDENQKSFLSYGLSGTYSLTGYNKGDLSSDVFLALDMGRGGELKAEAAYSAAQPAWLMHRFWFGNIGWQTDFSKQKQFMASMRYALPERKFHVSATLHRVKGLAYWNTLRLPAQSNAAHTIWVLEAYKLFRISSFGFENILRVQVVSDKSLFRFPVYWGVHSFFYERGLFKGNLLTRIGMDIRYNTNFSAPGYFPLTAQFHLQEDAPLVFYPVLDVYLLFKIKTVRLFLKMQHVNQGMFRDRGYFSAYKYPAADRNFRFGISWMFLD